MLSGRIPIKPLEIGSTKQFRVCNIPQFLQHRVWNWIINTNQVWIYKKTTEFKCSRKIHDSLAMIEDVMMKPVHDINHTLRCTTWKTKPQARLSILILSKAYPTKGILSPLSRHARLLAWGFVCRKAVKSRSLISYFSFLVLVQLTILGEHLSNSIHGGKQLSFIIQPTIFIIIIIFHFLLYVAKGLSSPKPWEADDSNRIC